MFENSRTYIRRESRLLCYGKNWKKIAEKLIPKLLILNMPMLEYTSLWMCIDTNEQMASILQQIQSLKKLSIFCTLFEDFIPDIFQIPQITSLR